LHWDSTYASGRKIISISNLAIPFSSTHYAL
jgi:hypothetical protein